MTKRNLEHLQKLLRPQVLPSNIEKDLITHPAVEDVAVVGLPHELDMELPVAFIVLKAGKSATAEELIKFVEGRFSVTSIIFQMSCSGETLHQIFSTYVENNYPDKQHIP